MKALPTNFNIIFNETILNYLWELWTSIGLGSHSIPKINYIIDPESLLIFSCNIARYDPRLFDEIIDWLILNGKYINIQKLKIKQISYPGDVSDIISAIAKLVFSYTKDSRWKSIIFEKKSNQEIQPLFYFTNGKPIPVFKESDQIFLEYGLKRNKFKPTGNSNSIPKNYSSLPLMLRTVFGCNLRADILSELIVQDNLTTKQLSNMTGLSWPAVKDIIDDFILNGQISCNNVKNHKYYTLNQKNQLMKLLGISLPKQAKPKNLFGLFKTLIIIFEAVNNPYFLQLTQLGLESEWISIQQKTSNANVNISEFFNLKPHSNYYQEIANQLKTCFN